ncbi:hypothetical protein [Piscinibacter koreensis]|uniref:Uncharacterized protein n=1 Tax=Piscinibacter koreensis TaxID=2742824 RepID=A0A7Y6NMX4_9BURK|nr:hypothetical protein [Schlegelella koreensis]NUZ06029.1 hypothetical protein [Schlegelella koreensis]
MSKQDTVADAPTQKRPTIEASDAPKDVARPAANARAWSNVNKLPGAGKKIDARRKVPSGPLGGSGRKTNRSRSS